MPDTITESEYDEKLDSMAETLVSECRESDPGNVREAVMEGMSEDVTYDNWFARSYYDLTLYAQIIEHSGATDRDNAPQYVDWDVAFNSASPEKTVKGLAQLAMENDLMNRATNLLDGDE